MEHIWQSSQEHTSGPLDVAKHWPRLRPVAYLGAVPVLPSLEKPEKVVPFFCGADMGHLSKELPELPGIGGLREAAAPGQTLPLDMNQASLYYDTGPELPDCLHNVRIAINRDGTRVQPIPHKAAKKGKELRIRALGDTVLTSHDHMTLRIHHGNKAPWAIKKGPVKYDVLALPQSQNRFWRHLLQIVVKDAVKLCRAMFALLRQLPNRIPFNDPTSEPFLLSSMFGRIIAPAERTPARATKPTSPTITVVPVSLESG